MYQEKTTFFSNFLVLSWHIEQAREFIRYTRFLSDYLLDWDTERGCAVYTVRTLYVHCTTVRCTYIVCTCAKGWSFLPNRCIMTLWLLITCVLHVCTAPKYYIKNSYSSSQVIIVSPGYLWRCTSAHKRSAFREEYNLKSYNKQTSLTSPKQGGYS